MVEPLYQNWVAVPRDRRKTPQRFVAIFRGGPFLSSFKLPQLCSDNVLILVERLCELGYSLETVIAILSRPSEKSEDVIL